MLAMMLTSGCLGAVDDIEDELDRTIQIIVEDYPQLDLPERTRTQPTLQTYDECDALLLDLKNSLFDEMLVRLDQESYYHWIGGPWMWRDGGVMFGDDVAVAESAADDGGSNSGSNSASTSREGEFSGTNNQEAGVDEADFLKTDGFHIYMLNGQSLVIMDVPEFGEIGLSSEIEIEGSPLQMMIDGDKLVIASMIYAWNLPEDHPLRDLLIEEVQWGEGKETYTYYRTQNLVKYTIVDISDRTAPEVDRELYIEGYYHTARMVDGTVRSVTHNYANFDGLRYWVDLPSEYWEIENEEDRIAAWQFHLHETIQHNQDVINGLTLADFAPQMYEMTESGIASLPITSEDCSEFAASTDSVSKGFTSIITFQLLNSDVEMEVDHIASSWVHVYASQDMLILAEPANDWWWFWQNTDFDDATNIHAFDISDSTTTSYLGSGRVDGTVQDQFSMSEYDDSIRIATTSDIWGRWWLTEEVDPETGKVDILRYTTFIDAGRAAHPSYVEGQMQGGALQGIGWALNEEYYFTDDGTVANSSFLDYRMPTSLDLPMIDTVIIEVPNDRHPFGIRGVGETVLIPPMAAIANAIHDAIGVRMTKLPMSPGAILEALEDAG